MMASIPNMRSAPLPVPAAKAAAAGSDGAPGDFAIQLPVMPAAADIPAVPGQPAVATPPAQAPVPVDLADGLAPQVVAPEDAEESNAGDEKMRDRADAPKKDSEAAPTIVIPLVQQAPAALPPQPVPTAAAANTPPLGTEVKTADTAPARQPRIVAGNGKAVVPVPDVPDAPEAKETHASALESAIKALLQRKPLPAKQVATPSTAEVVDTARAGPASATAQILPKAVRAEPIQTQAPGAPAVPHAAAALPAAEVPQPALSPAAAQPLPVAAEKAPTVDAPRPGDLAVERKLDLARDSAWLDRLAHDIARVASDDTPLRFRLHPQTLGHLQVELQQGDRGTAVRMTVDTEAARQILADAQPRLAAEARAQGVRIAETHVDLSGSGRQAPGDQRRQDDARQTPLIRTATGAGAEAVAAARSSRRARLDRYA